MSDRNLVLCLCMSGLFHNDIRFNKENQTAEIERPVILAWAAFGRFCYIPKNRKYQQYLNTKGPI